jgi:DDE_Tnp_1-associated/Transposase DDE domain
MPVSHARTTAVTSTDEDTADEVPGLLEVLAQVPDPRERRGRRFTLVFVLAVAVACALAGAASFREIGDQARDLPQELLARLGGRPHPLWRRIIAPSEKRIRTLIQMLDAARLDELIGGWLRALADAGRLENLLTAVAIDGKWLRGIGDGQQVKLFAAMLHKDKVVIAQHAIPEDTNEITQVKELLDPVDLENAVITGDAAHAQHGTAEYIAGSRDDGNRGADYFLFVKGNQPGLQRAIYDAIQLKCPREPDQTRMLSYLPL